MELLVFEPPVFCTSRIRQPGMAIPCARGADCARKAQARKVTQATSKENDTCSTFDPMRRCHVCQCRPVRFRWRSHSSRAKHSTWKSNCSPRGFSARDVSKGSLFGMFHLARCNLARIYDGVLGWRLLAIALLVPAQENPICLRDGVLWLLCVSHDSPGLRKVSCPCASRFRGIFALSSKGASCSSQSAKNLPCPAPYSCVYLRDSSPQCSSGCLNSVCFQRFPHRLIDKENLWERLTRVV